MQSRKQVIRAYHPNIYTVIEGSEVCPPEYGGWSEFEPAGDEECEKNEQTGKWTKPAKRYCNNPEPKYGGICDGKF